MTHDLAAIARPAETATTFCHIWVFGCRADDDVPFGHQFTGFGIWDGRKIGDERGLGLGRFRLAKQEILFVLWITLHVQLCREHSLAVLMDRIMNVWRTPDVLCWLDTAEVVLARRAGQNRPNP